jgi:hypothetical protein
MSADRISVISSSLPAVHDFDFRKCLKMGHFETMGFNMIALSAVLVTG